jgi:hypothetical protein
MYRCSLAAADAARSLGAGLTTPQWREWINKTLRSTNDQDAPEHDDYIQLEDCRPCTFQSCYRSHLQSYLIHSTSISKDHSFHNIRRKCITAESDRVYPQTQGKLLLTPLVAGLLKHSRPVLFITSAWPVHFDFLGFMKTTSSYGHTSWQAMHNILSARVRHHCSPSSAQACTVYASVKASNFHLVCSSFYEPPNSAPSGLQSHTAIHISQSWMSISAAMEDLPKVARLRLDSGEEQQRPLFSTLSVAQSIR